MKYIVFDNKYPVIFPDDLIHCSVSVEGMKPTSAGHVKIKTFGVSESLGIGGKVGDKELITSLFII